MAAGNTRLILSQVSAVRACINDKFDSRFSFLQINIETSRISLLSRFGLSVGDSSLVGDLTTSTFPRVSAVDCSDLDSGPGS